LVDCGGFEKLERFGRYVTVRPEPQAIWHKSLPEEEWERMASAVFRRDANSEERGRWLLGVGMPEQWRIDYRYRGMSLRMRLGLTSFKHVGVFGWAGNRACSTSSPIRAVRRWRPGVQVRR
jgi:23S rRNA (cytosine1962-C5)-methyltransferase